MDNSIDEGIKTIEETKQSNKIYGYKIGSLWVLEKGISILHDVSCVLGGTEKKLILDMQKWGTDIPSIIEKQVKAVGNFVDELIVCPMGGGRQSLRTFAEACIEQKIKPICVVKMTQPDSDSYLNKNSARNIYFNALEYGIDTFVVPATKNPKELSFMTIGEKYATGFKSQGGQTQPMIDFGVTKYIVGRAIYDSSEPLQEIKKIHKEICL